MSTIITAEDVALRLLLTLVAAGIIGANRSEHGRAAGLRTTILVSLAASVSMIQANLLLGSTGKAHDSFVVLDLMRLPLGILSGMGFIGAGAILRRGKLVIGVTTAATLWFVTVMGLCFGGGQLWLGGGMLGLGIFVLWILKALERRLDHDQRGRLLLCWQGTNADGRDARTFLEAHGFRILNWDITHIARHSTSRLKCRLEWKSETGESEPPSAIVELASRPGVLRYSWRT